MQLIMFTWWFRHLRSNTGKEEIFQVKDLNIYPMKHKKNPKYAGKTNVMAKSNKIMRKEQ